MSGNEAALPCLHASVLHLFIYERSSIAECSIVQQLYSDLEQMYTLLNASRQQYDDRLQLVHRHTADTQSWISSMDEKHGWVSQLSGSSVETHNIFHVTAVCL